MQALIISVEPTFAMTCCFAPTIPDRPPLPIIKFQPFESYHKANTQASFFPHLIYGIATQMRSPKHNTHSYCRSLPHPI